jgi:serine protease Do
MFGVHRWFTSASHSAKTVGLIVSSAGIACALESPTPDFGELLKVQAQVQSQLSHVSRALVAVESDDGAASGVIVSPDGLVMTAEHVTNQPGRKLKLRLADGRQVTAQALGLDRTTDAALMRIDGDKKDWPHVEPCRDLRQARAGTWCFALGHPGGYDAKRGAVLRVGKVIKQMANGLQTDCVLMGGDSGGPLFNLEGEIIGIHSQIWAGRDQNVHVSVAPFLRAWDALAKSSVVRSWGSGVGGWVGLMTQTSKQGELEVLEVAPESPAEKAGIIKGEIILSVDKEKVNDQPRFSEAISSRPSGSVVALQVKGKSGERRVTLKLSTRPEVEP